MQDRMQIRVSKNLLAKFKLSSGEFMGYVFDVAKIGLGFTSNRELQLGEEMEISLNVPNFKTMELKGAICWVRELPRLSRSKFQYGTKITEHNEHYDEFVEFELKKIFERRKHQRFTAVLEVKNEDVLDLLDAATTDVSAGGLYIRTGVQLEVGRQFEMTLVGKEFTEPLGCLGEVITSFETQSDDLDYPYGAGVKIISFANDDKARFSNFIKELEALYQFHWPEEMQGKM